MLEAAGAALQSEFAGLEIDAVCGDFEEHLAKIPVGGRRLFVFLGSTIGNLTPGPRAAFLSALADVLEPGIPCCWVPTWSRTSGGWSAPTTTAPV